MANYQFRFTAFEKLREAELDRRRVDLAEAGRAVDAIGADRAAVEGELAELRQKQQDISAGPELDVAKLLAAKRFETVLRLRHGSLMAQEAKLVADEEACRLAVVEAQREMRALETLDRRQRAEHRQDQGRRDAKELDEVALRRQAQKQGVAR